MMRGGDRELKLNRLSVDVTCECLFRDCNSIVFITIHGIHINHNIDVEISQDPIKD